MWAQGSNEEWKETEKFALKTIIQPSNNTPNLYVDQKFFIFSPTFFLNQNIRVCIINMRSIARYMGVHETYHPIKTENKI